MFQRKVYQKLLIWKEKYASKQACLLEGARQVGKTTIAEHFAQNEYKSYIKIDFANTTEEILDIFSNTAKLDLLFLRLQTETGIKLIEGESAIIFDQIQCNSKARNIAKDLVKDGRYHYIETAELLSSNRKSEEATEYKIKMYPMDYEEFLWAAGSDSNVFHDICRLDEKMGNLINRKLMRDFRLYMAVGGMPQAVETYIATNNFDDVDRVKRQIIELYLEDLNRMDESGKLAKIYKAIPIQLALKKKHFIFYTAIGKPKTEKDERKLAELWDSNIVLACYHLKNPDITAISTYESDKFRLYMADTGLLVTMLFDKSMGSQPDIYNKLLSDKLDADLVYLYENAAAQMLTACERKLYYHTWKKENSSHFYEIDFLITLQEKIIPIEIKSSAGNNERSILAFAEKYSMCVGKQYLFSQNDVSQKENLELKPIYMLPFLFEEDGKMT